MAKCMVAHEGGEGEEEQQLCKERMAAREKCHRARFCSRTIFWILGPASQPLEARVPFVLLLLRPLHHQSRLNAAKIIEDGGDKMKPSE